MASFESRSQQLLRRRRDGFNTTSTGGLAVAPSWRAAAALLVAAILLTLAPSFAAAVEMAHVPSDSDVVTSIAFATVQCGGLITIDSLHPNVPGATASSSHLPYYPATSGAAGPSYVRYSKRKVSANYARLIEDTIQTSATNVILFEIDASAVPVGSPCDVQWDPRISWVRSVEASSLSFAVFDAIPTGQQLPTTTTTAPSSSTTATAAEVSMCANVQLGFNTIRGSVTAPKALSVGADDPFRTSVYMNTLNTRFSGGENIADSDAIFPMTVLAPPQCTVTIALISTHYGKYTALARWLPLLIYSVVFLPMVLIVGRRRVGDGARRGVAVLAVAFIGYAGCCVGLGIELATWSYPLHPFPFPGAVTMYFVAAICYGLAILWLLYGHPLRVIATHTGFNALLYGLSIGLMVGYFMRAFLVLGIVAAAMIGLINLIIIAMTVWFAAYTPKSFRIYTGSSSLRTLLVWFPLTAPIVPVTFFALQLGWTGAEASANRRAAKRWRAAAYSAAIAAEGGGGHSDILGGGLGVDDGQSTVYADDGTPRQRRATSTRRPVNRLQRTYGAVPTDTGDMVMSRLAISSLHSVFTSFFMIVFHNMATFALLVAASCDHTPFVVAIFPVACLLVLHLAFSLQEYSKIVRRYGEPSSFGCCGRSDGGANGDDAVNANNNPNDSRKGDAVDASGAVSSSGGHRRSIRRGIFVSLRMAVAYHDRAEAARVQRQVQQQRQRSRGDSATPQRGHSIGAAAGGIGGYYHQDQYQQQQQKYAHNGYSGGGTEMAAYGYGYGSDVGGQQYATDGGSAGGGGYSTSAVPPPGPYDHLRLRRSAAGRGGKAGGVPSSSGGGVGGGHQRAPSYPSYANAYSRPGSPMEGGGGGGGAMHASNTMMDMASDALPYDPVVAQQHQRQYSNAMSQYDPSSQHGHAYAHGGAYDTEQEMAAMGGYEDGNDYADGGGHAAHAYAPQGPTTVRISLGQGGSPRSASVGVGGAQHGSSPEPRVSGGGPKIAFHRPQHTSGINNTPPPQAPPPSALSAGRPPTGPTFRTVAMASAEPAPRPQQPSYAQQPHASSSSSYVHNVSGRSGSAMLMAGMRQ